MTEYTRAELAAQMKSAGFQVQYVSLEHAREIVSGESDSVWCENASDSRSYVSRPYATQSFDRYYADATVTCFLLGDVASDCQYSNATTYDASNLRSLLRDYPNRVFRYSYRNGDVGAVLLACLDDDLTETLTGLKEQYPVYDESDHSEYESELAEKAWDDYVHLDLTFALNGALLNGGLDVDLNDVISEDDLRQLFYQAGHESAELYRWTDGDGVTHESETWEFIEYESEAGSPDSVIFPRQDEVTERITEIVIGRARAASGQES